MTWYWEASDTLDVWDHNGTQVADSREFSQRWTGTPDEVLAVMREEAAAAIVNLDTEYAVCTLAAAAFEDIEEGAP